MRKPRRSKRIVKKVTKAWLDRVAYIAESDIKINDSDEPNLIYLSKFDNSCITLVGFEYEIFHLAKAGITIELRNGTGYSPSLDMWFGWTHRGMCGFTIGSTCKAGDCHFKPSNIEEYIDRMLTWYADTDMEDSYKINATAQDHIQDGKHGFLIEYDYNDEVPNELMRGQHMTEFVPYPKEFGKGEWVAETMEDAKQMAYDFCKALS